MKMLIDKDWCKRAAEGDEDCTVGDISEALKSIEIKQVANEDFITYYCKGHVIDAFFMLALKRELNDDDHYLLNEVPDRAYFKAAYNFQEETTWYYECEPTVRGCFPITYVRN